LVDALAVSYPTDLGPEFLTDFESEVAKYVSTHPKTVNRLKFLIDYIKTYRCQELAITGRIFNERSAIFEQLDDLDWMTAVAQKHRLTHAGCGHWSRSADLMYLQGNAEAYNHREIVCTECGNRMLESGQRSMHNSQNQLYMAEYAVIYTSPHEERVMGDSRDPNIVFDDRRQIYHHVNWTPYNNLIQGYHSSKAKGFNIIDSPWFRSHRRAFGCELEVQVRNGATNLACGKVHDVLNPGGELGEYCYFERDGSIGDGFEIVTQPAGLDIHRAKFEAFLTNDELKRGLRSHEGGACGFHVHVGRQYVTQSQIYRIQSFLNDVRNESLIRAVARRYDSGFSKFKPQMAKFTAAGKNNGDRYEALNVTGRDTIEFRIFRGSLRYESIVSALEFVNAVLTFCTPGVTAITDFHAIGFKRFIMSDEMKSDTKFLRSYLSLDTNTDNERKAA